MEGGIVSIQMLNIIFHYTTGGPSTNPIPYDADLVTVQDGLEYVSVERTPAFNGDESIDAGYSVTLEDKHSIIRDTIIITQPDDFKGNINLIQSELPNSILFEL
jgi:hypothetical protein